MKGTLKDLKKSPFEKSYLKTATTDDEISKVDLSLQRPVDILKTGACYKAQTSDQSGAIEVQTNASGHAIQPCATSSGHH